MNSDIQARMSNLCESVEKKFKKILRPWQKEAIEKIIQGNDLIITAGTGSGKSLVFQSLCFAKKNGIVLIVAPLKSLINNHVCELRSHHCQADILD